MGFKETINLLNASSIVSISGGLRFYVAFLLAGKKPEISLCIAAILMVYATYTFDRAVKRKEDEINRIDEENANKNLALFIVFVSSSAAILILAENGISPILVFFPFTMGLMYSKGINIGSFSLNLKRRLGIKNCFVAFTWSFTIIALVRPHGSPQLILIFVFFFSKSFINTIIFDFKDVTGDSYAGLTTFPLHFGEASTRLMLQIIHSSLHLALIALSLLNLAEFELFILFYGWIVGIIYIFLYATSKKTISRSLVIHGEWAHMLLFRSFVDQLF
ncbi:MAG: UbiA family prenyltransferase [Candidatus Methanoperedens sp.]|nr:UbiA family prenyltransferase [Candidatus Methanoperedens sp.]MCZ7371870.1 UbiA family prenyltransferase [Candidatus Methanoperedens sp.]